MKAALQFSGGRDSLALLWHMQSLWDLITVVHVDTGDQHELTREVVADIEKRVPHFVRLHSDSRKHRFTYGNPTDADWVKCCWANLWLPMAQWLKDNGVQQVLRGTKAVDPFFHGVMPGDVREGVLYTMPLWHWSDANVDAFLGDHLPLPYRLGATAMPDCKGCTAGAATDRVSMGVWERVAKRPRGEFVV